MVRNYVAKMVVSLFHRIDESKACLADGPVARRVRRFLIGCARSDRRGWRRKNRTVEWMTPLRMVMLLSLVAALLSHLKYRHHYASVVLQGDGTEDVSSSVQMLSTAWATVTWTCLGAAVVLFAIDVAH